MRSHQLLLSLTLTLALGVAPPAMGADFGVDVPEYAFKPAELEIEVGDTVTWTFSDEVRHSTKALGGQGDSWNSSLQSSGSTFIRTFARPGRFDYICEPHPFMEAAITVGKDAEKDTYDKFKRTRRGNDVKVTFELNEAANVTYELKGPSKRTVKRGRLGKGQDSFRVKNLKKGRYTGTLVMVDDFDKKATAKSSFRIR